MKRVFFAAVFLAAASLVHAEVYSVRVTRRESNVYVDREQRIAIITKYCYEYATEEKAALIYDRYDTYNNKLVFSSGTCAVDKVVTLG